MYKKIAALANCGSYLWAISKTQPLSLFRHSANFFQCYRRQFSPDEIRLLNLAADRAKTERGSLISNETMLRLQAKLNPAKYRPLTENKIDFYRHCRRHNLRHAPVLLMAHREGFFDLDGNQLPEDSLQLLEDGPYLFKPSQGTHAKGIFKAIKIDDQFVCRFSADRLDPIDSRGLGDFLRNEQTLGNYLVQPLLTPHRSIEAFSGSQALQTIRVVTLRVDGETHIIARGFRQAAPGATFDNFDNGKSGNSSWSLDDAGRLQCRYAPGRGGFGMEVIQRHPDFTLPYWDNALELIRDAAEAFLPLKTIGWDVGLTDDGPILIEGNAFWDQHYVFPEYVASQCWHLMQQEIDSQGTSNHESPIEALT